MNRLKAVSILCQVSLSNSGIMSKIKIDSAPALTAVPLGRMANFLLSCPFIHINTTIFSSNQTGYIFLNKVLRSCLSSTVP